MYFKVIRRFIRAHRYAANVIRIIDPDAKIGVAKDNIYFEAGPGVINRLLKSTIDWLWNHHFLSNIKKHLDFIGLNNYFHSRINYGLNKNEDETVSDMGYELYPEAMYQVLKGLKRYRKPVIITENGLADAKDNKRTEYIKAVLTQVHRAIRAGVDVRGYLHWSLLDNFEWDKGFWPRFGLVEIDYKNKLKRKVRGSAKEYAKIIKANAVTSE